MARVHTVRMVSRSPKQRVTNRGFAMVSWGSWPMTASLGGLGVWPPPPDFFWAGRLPGKLALGLAVGYQWPSVFDF